MASALRSSIDKREFWLLEDDTALHMISAAFSPEFNRLVHAPAAAESPDSGEALQETPASPSLVLFGRDSDEVNRTLVCILALKWIITGNYSSFAARQPASTRLEPSSFQELQKFFRDKLFKPNDALALITAVVINDLGKVGDLVEAIAAKTGRSYTSQNHDAVLYEAVRLHMVDCVENLDDQQKSDLILGIKLGAQLNLAQLAQAENVPGSLEFMLSMRQHRHTFDLKFMEQVLDVAGAAGHIDFRCARQFSEPVFQAFMISHRVLTDIVEGRSNLRQGYDEVLLARAVLVERSGFRRLSVNDSSERALLRLITMGRTTNKEQAEWFSVAFDSLPSDSRDQLIGGLNVDGYNDGKAIIPYYAPAIFVSALQVTQNDSTLVKVAALASMMRFLARVFAGTYPRPGTKGEIVEHDLMYLKSTILSDEFRKDPRILDEHALSTAARYSDGSTPP